MMWVAALLLMLVVLLAVRGRRMVPHGLYNFIEVLVAFVRNEIAVPNMGARDADRFVPYLVTAFFFILFMNLLGLVPWSATATANLSVTVMMALFTFVITQATAIRAMGFSGFLAHLTGGVPRSLWPLSSSWCRWRSWGSSPSPSLSPFVSSPTWWRATSSSWRSWGSSSSSRPGWHSARSMALGIFLLELFVAFVQAYIFTMLSSLFIGAGLAQHGEHHSHRRGRWKERIRTWPGPSRAMGSRAQHAPRELAARTRTAVSLTRRT